MAPALPTYTPYRDVNIILHRLRTDVEGVLGDQLVGIYLYGSLSLGDFDPKNSDIDFLVVTKDVISEETLEALKGVHGAIGNSNLPFAKELEGSYFSQDGLRRHDSHHEHHPYINSHDEHGITVRFAHHGQDWDIQRWIVREHGVTVVGPPPSTLIDPVPARAIQQGVRNLLFGWWQEMLESPLLQEAGYQAFAILTMCRMLYTFAHGTVVSKPVATRWALENLDTRWHGLIQWATTYPEPPPYEITEEIKSFIRYTMKQSEQAGT